MALFVKRVWQKHRWVRLAVIGVLITLAIVLVGGGGIATWLQWEWLRSSEVGKASNGDTLRNVGFIVAGGIALAFALWRAVVAQSQAKAAHGQSETAQQSLRNERYQRGAEMLGNTVLSVRLGAIFALQRLAEEHPGQYHVQITGLLCAFVKNPTGGDRELVHSEELRSDIQASMDALVKRGDHGRRLESEAGFRLDLKGAKLAGAKLIGARLSGADLTGADLYGADLTNADLLEADLFDAIVSGAILGSDPTSPMGSPCISQEQIYQTQFDTDNPPIIRPNTIDPQTGEQVTLHGHPLNPQS